MRPGRKARRRPEPRATKDGDGVRVREFRAICAALGALMLAAAFAEAETGDGGARGRQLFALCTQCHGVDGGGRREYQAPAIAGLPQWYVSGQLEMFRSGLRGQHFDDAEGMRMRPMSLALASDADLQAVSAHTASLPLVPQASTLPGNAAVGSAYYGPCIGCHGLQGEGREPLFAPPLVGQSDWYLLSAMQKYKAGARGYGLRGGDHPPALAQRAALAQGMAGFSQVLASEQAILDVIAYILSLEPSGGGGE